MRPRCTWRRARSMLPRPRSPCACARPRPAHPVRCAPPRPGASIVTTSAPWQTCPGRSIGCPSSCGCANGFAAIVPVHAASSPSACPRWRPPGRAAPCAWPSAWWRSASRWAGKPGYASATRGTCGSAGTRSCASSAGSQSETPPRLRCSASTTGRYAKATRMARSSWTWSATSPSPCCRIARRTPWPSGSGSIQGSR